MLIIAILAITLIILLLLLALHNSNDSMHAQHRKHLQAKKQQVSTHTGGPTRKRSFVASSSTTTDEPKADEEAIEIPEQLKGFHLLQLSDLDDKLRLTTEAMTSGIPRPRNLFLALTRDVRDPKKLAEVVRSDPEIAAKILRMVNSSYYCLSTEITSIHHAVVYLGANFVKDIAIQVAVQSSIKPGNPDTEAAYRKVWSSSVIASAFALKLAQLLKLSNAPELSTLALLLSIGNLATLAHNTDLADLYAQEGSLFNRTQQEQDKLGLNSSLVGAVLASHWRLPPTIETVIGHSLAPMAMAPQHCEIDDDKLLLLTFSYIAARVGDLVVYDGIRDIGDIDLDNHSGVEYFYLPHYLKKIKLPYFKQKLKDGTLRHHMNILIDEVVMLDK